MYPYVSYINDPYMNFIYIYAKWKRAQKLRWIWIPMNKPTLCWTEHSGKDLYRKGKKQSHNSSAITDIKQSWFQLSNQEKRMAFLCNWHLYIEYSYLFIYFWLCWVFICVRGFSVAAASRGHSSSRCAGLSLSRPLLLRSTGSRRAGSVVVAHGPSCSAARGIFPDQSSNPCHLHWQADSQPLRHQGSPSLSILKFSFLFIRSCHYYSFYLYFSCTLKRINGAIFKFQISYLLLGKKA